MTIASTGGQPAPPKATTSSRTRAKVAERGWLAPHWPKEYGGAGLTVMEQFIMNEEFATHRAWHPGGRAVEMVGPTVILHGTEAQKAELLPPILKGEHVYCQGFSEPGAGSDLASLQTRAVRDGDDYVLNGQKIWTSNAPTGCSCSRAPTRRRRSTAASPISDADQHCRADSIRTIPDMAGGYDLCETFFDGVRVPASLRIGEENRGWYVAMTTLDFERSGIAGAISVQLGLLDLIKVAKPLTTAAHRVRLADLFVATEVARQMSYHVASLQDRGLVPNYESSMVKLFASELYRRIDTEAVTVLGLRGTLYRPSAGYEVRDGRIARSLSGSIPMTIAGGSSEVQRGIIATRGLGLPRG